MAQVGIAPNPTFLSRAAITFSGSGDNALVAAVAGQIVQVYRIFFVVGGTTNLTFKDGASTSLSGAMPFIANGAMVLDNSGDPWFTTTAGNAFILNSSSGVQISGTVYYLQKA